MRILLADDDEAMRFFLSGILEEDLGFDVVSVPDGVRAVQALRSSAFDAVVLDAFMPGLNGFEVLEEIAELGLSARIVMISGDRLLGERALAAGAYAFVGKPFDYRDLILRLTERPTRSST